MHLLLGCGSARDKRMGLYDRPEDDPGWVDLVTCDINPTHEPDVVWDLRKTPWEPFETSSAEEIHAYEVMEHIGQQGDVDAFFAQFNEIWRILKPNGVFCCTVPAPDSVWVWGDPGHTRTIAPETLVFLEQKEYDRQIGHTTMSDYRPLFKGDFAIVYREVSRGTFWFILQALKGAS